MQSALPANWTRCLCAVSMPDKFQLPLDGTQGFKILVSYFHESDRLSSWQCKEKTVPTVTAGLSGQCGLLEGLCSGFRGKLQLCWALALLGVALLGFGYVICVNTPGGMSFTEQRNCQHQ